MLTATALLWTRIIAGLCVFIAVALARSIWQASTQVANGKIWSATSGEILQSGLDRPRTGGADDEPDCGVMVRYRYRAAGKDHEGDRLAFGAKALMTQAAAEAVVARYPVGAKVKVYFDPRHPARSVLERKSATPFAHYVFLGVFAAVGGILTAHGIAGQVLYTAGGIPLFAYLLPLACLFGAGLGIYGFAEIRRQQRLSAAWPTTPGRITKSSVIEFEETDRDSNETTTKYRAAIAYRYRLGRHDYLGTTRKWGWTEIYATAESARAALAAFPVGRDVAVHYDPAAPATSVLEPGNRKGAFAPLFFSAGFGGMAVLMLWAFSKVG